MRHITPHLLSLRRLLLQLAPSSNPIVSETELPVYGFLENQFPTLRVLGNPACIQSHTHTVPGRIRAQYRVLRVATLLQESMSAHSLEKADLPSGYTLPPLAPEKRRPKWVGGGYEDLTPTR